MYRMNNSEFTEILIKEQKLESKVFTKVTRYYSTLIILLMPSVIFSWTHWKEGTIVDLGVKYNVLSINNVNVHP